jgi:DNA replication initiation complex subunit (GINS family)
MQERSEGCTVSERYDRLHEAWSKERQNKDLQNIPDDMLHEMKDYIATINKTPTDENTLAGQLTRTEKKYANQLLRELTELRLKKIVTLEINNQPIDAQAMTPEEQKLHSNFRQLLTGFRQGSDLPDVALTPVTPKPEPKKQVRTTRAKPTPKPIIKPDEVEVILVRFLQPLPAIMGIDMKAYGPFQPEELATIPAQNAENLIKRGIAKPVEVEP